MSKMLSRDDILAADDLPTEVVETPEWKGSVRVRALTAHERSQYESAFTIEVRTASGDTDIRHNRPAQKQIRERLVAFTVIDEAGNRLFTTADVEALGKKSSAALTRVFDVAQRLSGMTKADHDELKKNSSETDDADSSSVSLNALDGQSVN